MDESYHKILSIDYVPRVPDMYAYFKSKYGLTTTLKTQFIFKDKFILLGNMTESKLISTIKRECKI
jgi:hypothetical protein